MKDKNLRNEIVSIVITYIAKWVIVVGLTFIAFKLLTTN